jgi:hypothetical protein
MRGTSSVGVVLAACLLVLLLHVDSVAAFTTKKPDRKRPITFQGGVNPIVSDDVTATATASSNPDTSAALPANLHHESSTTATKQYDSTHSFASGGGGSIPPPFGVVNGAAVAYGPSYYQQQQQYQQQHQQQLEQYYAQQAGDDEELITVSTAVVSCLLSLILGFGLGYGT